MPLIRSSSYQKPRWMLGPHMETILPSVIRHIKLPIAPQELVLETPDGDFIEYDLYAQDSNRLVIISHGLEGNSRRPYVLGMVKQFLLEGWGVLAWNYRGCGGKVNRKPNFYHSGFTVDLRSLVNEIGTSYACVSLVGFSLGGNLTLKYLGEEGVNNNVKSAVVYSVPLDLAGCSIAIDSAKNSFYRNRFLKSLKRKIASKRVIMPNFLPSVDLAAIKTIYDFDDKITAVISGFENADDYYQQNSAMSFISNIGVPTLVVNAQNDPFLSRSCFDQGLFEQSGVVFLETPTSGGHVGFSASSPWKSYWSEQRAFEFVRQYI